MKESGCQVDPGSRVERVLTRSDCKVEKDTVTLDKEKGEISFVVESHVSQEPGPVRDLPEKRS